MELESRMGLELLVTEMEACVSENIEWTMDALNEWCSISWMNCLQSWMNCVQSWMKDTFEFWNKRPTIWIMHNSLFHKLVRVIHGSCILLTSIFQARSYSNLAWNFNGSWLILASIILQGSHINHALILTRFLAASYQDITTILPRYHVKDLCKSCLKIRHDSWDKIMQRSWHISFQDLGRYF